MLDRGETLTAIAELAGIKVSELRAVLKSAGARRAHSGSRRRGAPSIALDAPQIAEEGAVSAAGDAPRPVSVGGSA